MTRVGVQGMARELASSPVPVTMTLTVQAWAGDKAYENIGNMGPVFSPKIVVVVHEDGRITRDNDDGPEVEFLEFVPTNGLFCYRWLAKRNLTVFEPRYTELPDVEQIQFGALQAVDPRTFQPTEESLAAWLATIATAVEARDASVTARTAAETAATAAAGSASTATSAKNSAAASAASAATAAGTAGDAATAAGQAATSAGTSAGAADGSARDAAASASAASQSKTAAATSATNAASSKTAAADSASAAGMSATAAAQSANTATQAATTATGAATDATAAKTAAQTSATNADTRATAAASSATAAATSATDADTRATDAAASATAASTAKTAAETAKAGAETARTGAETAQTGAQSARTDAVAAKTAAEAARDLALAGQFAGSDLGGSNTNLDTMLTPGVYYQTRAAQATLANKYPVAGLKGSLIVTRATGAFSEQLYIGEGGFGYYIRTGTSTAWTTWAFISTQKVDVTVGRRIFTRDDYNNRDQMIFGDTGWRDIKGLLVNGWTASSLILRRIGSHVELAVYNLNPAVATSDTLMTLPAGFLAGGYPGTIQLAARFNAAINWFRVDSAGVVYANRTLGTIAPASIDTMHFLTSNAWPTALPGDAYGVIPVN